jgi:hypothetical protein
MLMADSDKKAEKKRLAEEAKAQKLKVCMRNHDNC